MSGENTSDNKLNYMRETRKFFKKYIDLDVSENEWVSIHSILRNWKSILLVVVVLVLYIGNRYNCTKKMQEVRRLQSQIMELRHESVSLSSELTGIGHPSQIEKQLRNSDIELSPATEPSYKLIRKDYEE